MTDQKKGWDLGVVLALIAVLISICTMIISLVETSIMQKQQQSMTESAKASVWPYVTSNLNTKMDNGNIEFKVTIENKGVGPALINDLKVFYDDEPIDGSPIDYIKKHCPDAFPLSFYSNSSSKSVLSPGEVKKVLEVRLKNVDFVEFTEFKSRIEPKYCYSNIYGDSWKSVEGQPVEAKECQ